MRVYNISIIVVIGYYDFQLVIFYLYKKYKCNEFLTFRQNG